MTTLLYALWPLFALIVGGFLLRRWDFPGEAFWPAACSADWPPDRWTGRLST